MERMKAENEKLAAAGSAGSGNPKLEEMLAAKQAELQVKMPCPITCSCGAAVNSRIAQFGKVLCRRYVPDWCPFISCLVLPGGGVADTLFFVRLYRGILLNEPRSRFEVSRSCLLVAEPAGMRIQHDSPPYAASCNSVSPTMGM